MQASSSPLISTLTEWLVWIGLGVILLLIAPVFVNFMVTAKILLILVLALALVALFFYQSSLSKHLTFVHHPLTLPLVFFGIASALSTFIAGSYPVENLAGWGGVYLSFVIIALLGGALLPKEALVRFNTIITGLAIALSLSTLAQIVGIGPSRLLNALFGADLPHTGIFNLTGSPFIAAQFFAVTLVALGVSGFYRQHFSSLDLAGLGFSLLGLVTTVYLILPGKDGFPLILPFGASWSIALDTLHNFRAALVGLGPENYLAAYTQFRPAWINGQSWWNVLFSQASNLPLTLIVTTGFIGFFSWLYFLARLVMEAVKRHNLTNSAAVMTLSIGVLNLLLPANIVLMAVQAVALAVWIASQKSSTTVFSIHFFQVYSFAPSGRSFTAGKAIGLVLALAILGVGFYAVGRTYLASYAFFQSTVTLANNQVVEGYDLQKRAVTLNPYLSSYRSSYALTNMGIALALSNKADLTEEERTQVTQLVEQSIREARAATVLRPDLAGNWQVLAQIYRNLIGTAEGADQWTVTSYVSAIERAPADPQLRVELGQVFYQLKQYQQAVSLFSQAAELKPDMVNAYYNGANALKELGELAAAEQAYQKALSLLEPDSEDYAAASKELEALQAEIAKQPKPAETEETSQQQTVPSITEQNLLEPANETVTEPSTQNIEVSQPVPTPSASPATP